MQRKHPIAAESAKAGQPRDWKLCGHPHIPGTAFWEWDTETDFVRFSPEWEDILQSRDYESALPGKPEWWRQRVHQDDLEALVRASEDILAGKSDSYDVIYRLQRADGCWIWLLARGTVKEKKQGRPTKVSGILINISPLRTDPKFQMAETLGNAAFHAMLENSPDMIVRMDRELFPAYMNPVVVRYMGRKREDFKYVESREELKIEAQQLEFLQRNVARVFDEKKALREMVSFADAFGNEITGEYSFWPEFDKSGKVIYAMTQFRDRSEQVRAERRARINEKRLEALNRLTLMDNASEAEVLNFVMNRVLELTQSGSGFIFIPWGDSPYEGDMLWSEDHYRFLGREYLPGHVFPPDLIALITEEDGTINFTSMRNGDGIRPIRVSFDGQMTVMRSLVAPAMEGERVACIAGVCNKAGDYDEADLRQLETFINGAWLVIHRQRFLRELRRAKEAAEHANKVKDVFLANVSHELRTPLNGMLSMLQLLELLPMTVQQREYVLAASESGKALLRIISDILDFSRMESGRMQLQKEPFHFKETLCSTMRLFSSEAIKKGLKVAFFLDENIPDTLVGDEARFRQIIYNVVGNALKFTERGEITVHCVLLPREANGQAAGGPDERVRLHISVRDTGIGIPREKQEVIFEAFTQLDSSSTRRYAGTGLGLGIVRQLVGLMDGSIAIDSEEGKGTTVHCVLTFDPWRPRGRAAEQAGAAAPESENTARMDVLVAEDDDVGRFAIRSFLQRIGHRPLCVTDGRQALEALQLHAFDCLFTDIQMPGMDGLEVVRRIRTGRLEDIEPSDEVRAMVAEYAAHAPHAHLAPHAPHTSGEGRALLPVNRNMIVTAVSAHAMSGDRERFLEQGVDYYVSKPIRLNDLIAVLGDIDAQTRHRRRESGDA